MTVSSNVSRSVHDFIVDRNIGFDYYFKAKTVSGEDLDWSKVVSAQIDVKDKNGNLMISFSLGDGLKIADDPLLLIFSKTATEKNITPGVYYYDLKVVFNTTVVKRPVGGKYIVVDCVTI